MNRLFFVLVSSVALMFAACGDSGNGASPQGNADMDVRTYSELPSCAEKRDGKTAYVADQEQGYICQNGKWVEDDDVKVVDYPSSSTSSVIPGLTGNLLDTRDGQTYKIVTIGTQTWMAQNLNYETANSYCYSDTPSYCYSDTPSNCTKYGRLYTWAAAMDSAGTWSASGKGCGYGKTCSPTYPVRGVCPEGWHLPTRMEWNMYLPTQTNGPYLDEGIDALFWSSSESDYDNAYIMSLYYASVNAYLNDYKYNGFSVRCVKD